MKRPETQVADLQLSWNLQHAFACEIDSAECPECLKIQHGEYTGSWPPARMIAKETWQASGISFAENFDVKRVAHEYEREQQNAARKNGVRSMLRRLRGLPE